MDIKEIFKEYTHSTIICKGFIERNGKYIALLSKTNLSDNISTDIPPIFNEDPFNCSKNQFRNLINQAINEHNRSLCQ